MHISEYQAILDSMPRENRLLLLLSSVKPPLNRLGLDLVSAPFDWDRFYMQCCKHANVNLVTHHLEKLAGSLEVPEELHKRLLRHKALLDIKQGFLLEELKAISSDCGDSGFDFILLKGPILSHAFYPEPDMRSFIDLDILIHRQDYSACRDLLHGRGFKEVRYEENEITFGKAGNFTGLDLPVEVHFHLINFQYFPYYGESDLISPEPMWERSEVWTLKGIPVRVFCLEDQLIYACLHHFYHHRLSGLKYLSDLDAMLGEGSSRVDWGRFLDILSTMRVRGKVNLVLSCYSKLFGKEPVPAFVADAIRPSKWRGRLAWKPLPPPWEIPFVVMDQSYHLPKILALDRIRDMLRVALRWFFPGRRFLEHYFYLEPSQWKRIYYIIYASRILKKGVKRLILRRPLKPGEITPERKAQREPDTTSEETLEP